MTILTHVFRIANSLNETIKTTHVPSLSEVIFEGQRVPPPVQIPWYVDSLWIYFAFSSVIRYPGGLAWQFNVPKKALRKSEEVKKFHSFLVFETEVVRVSLCDGVLITST